MLSVLLPTIRPEAIEGCLSNLLAQSEDVPMEVVVVADFDPPVVHEPWIRRPRNGVVDAVNVAYRVARGECIFLTNDETTCAPGTLRRLYDAVQAHPDHLLTPEHQPAFPFYYYGRFFAAFPCACWALLERLGGLFDPIYRGFYADPDLSMRAHAAGVPISVVEGATILHRNDTQRPDHRAAVSAYLEADRATFRSRWDHLGAFCDP